MEKPVETTTEYLVTDYYDNEYEDDSCNKTDVIEFGAVLTPVFFSTVIIFSFFGNILVLIILVKYENIRSITNALILNLAISDLFFTTALPFWAHYHIYGWTMGETACRIINLIFYIGYCSSSFLLVLMTAHRYVAVMSPLSDIVSTTGLSSIIVSVSVWVISILVALPACIHTKVIEDIKPNYCGFVKSQWKLWEVYQQNALFILSSVVFIFCYSQILCKLLRRNPQRRRHKTLKLIFILIIVFFFGWAPYNIVIFLRSAFEKQQSFPTSESRKDMCETSKRLDYALYISRLLAFSHCCLNPVFYVFVGVKFKTHLKKMLRNWGQNNGGRSNRQSRLTITSITSE
ncbi:chemokine XC receptor 1 isoform 1-T2 [Menidia menidia]